MGEEKIDNNSIAKLYKPFEKKIRLSLPFYLLVLLGKQRSRIAYLSGFMRCVVVSNLYDRLNDTIQHF